MAIETKYNIGDVVWFRFMGNNIKSKVVDIEYSTPRNQFVGGGCRYRCLFYLTTSLFEEEELFPTESDLLKSL